jgi:hypothetical protein
VSAGLDAQLNALTAAYVLSLSIFGPILAQLVQPLSLVYKKAVKENAEVKSGRGKS